MVPRTPRQLVYPPRLDAGDGDPSEERLKGAHETLFRYMFAAVAQGDQRPVATNPDDWEWEWGHVVHIVEYAARTLLPMAQLNLSNPQQRALDRSYVH